MMYGRLYAATIFGMISFSMMPFISNGTPGKEIKTVSFSGKQLTIGRAEMNNGIYYLQITDDKKHVANKKIVVQ